MVPSPNQLSGLAINKYTLGLYIVKNHCIQTNQCSNTEINFTSKKNDFAILRPDMQVHAAPFYDQILITSHGCPKRERGHPTKFTLRARNYT